MINADFGGGRDQSVYSAGATMRFRGAACTGATGTALGAAIVAAVLAAPAGELAAAEATRVKAHYEVRFAGVDIGRFDFNSQTNGSTYRVTSTTNIKLLMGAFKWTARSVAEGRVQQSVTPSAFTFDYRSNRKKYRTEMAFAKGDVTSLVNEPPVRENKNRVAVEPVHLKDVMDPMSAILAMTRGTKRNPCDQHLDVFEGRMRFKLTLTANGQRKIEEQGNSGQPLTAYVCRVRFTPIAGHKPNEAMKRLAASDGIELVLRPVPAADLFVPYQITVPTGYGTVSIVSRNVEIEGEKLQRIAMRY